jgi:hypothetical protein
MASAAGVAGVRATLDLGSKSSKCVQCGEPDSARITGNPEETPIQLEIGSARGQFESRMLADLTLLILEFQPQKIFASSFNREMIAAVPRHCSQ